jgi:catechol 2,3-dioxygenase-like lactoylglutathione lyase family enzyme
VPELPQMHLDHVGLSVADLDALIAWYADALGLIELSRFAYEIGDRRVVGALLASRDGWRLELQQCDDSVPGQPANPLQSLLRQGLGHFCVQVPELDTVFDRLVQCGARISVPPMRSPLPGMRIAYVADPEGNLIELLEQRDVPHD